MVLRNNQLSNLPPEIRNLQNITKFDLSGNPISDNHIAEIKTWLPNCEVVFKPYHEYYNNNYEYKKVTNYYLTQINDTTGLSQEDKEIYANSFNNEGVKYANNNQTDSALIYYKKAVYYSNIGWAHSNLEQYEDAIIYWKKAIDLNPDNDIYYSNIGLAYYNLEQYEDAIIYYKKASEIEPTNDVFLNNIGNIYYRLEQYEDAIIYYKKALELKPDDATYGLIGDSYYNLEQYEEAIIHYKKASELKPTNHNYMRSIAVTYRQNKQYEKSLGYYDKTIELNPTGKHYHSRAFAYIKLGKFPEAKVDLEKAESLYPDNKWLYIYWSCYYALQKDTENAIKNLQTAIDKGFTDKKWLETETSLDFIRKDKRYIEIVEKME